MNKFWRLALNSLLIVSLWWVGLSLFASYRAKAYGVTPTFPYYSLLLSYAPAPVAVWGHFDGAHYLKLAGEGYVDQGTQAFFPAYPLIIRFIGQLGISLFTAARLVSFFSLVGAVILLQYLFAQRGRVLSILLLIFPTSFYLGAVYTESFFLFLTLLFFLLLKQRHFGWAALIAGVASGTRLVGSLLALSLLIELYPYLKSRRSLALLLPLSISGLLAYMYFLWQKFGDPLAFIHVQSMFGAGRSSGEIVMLPQVIYRYLNIFLTVSPLTLLFQRALLEFVVFVTFLGVLISRWKQLPLSWSVYILGSLLLPTLSGTLSSLPRYVLVLLPFLLVSPKSNLKYFVLILASAVFLLILLSLFVSGQFVS